MTNPKSVARREQRSVLERILETPNLEQVVPRLQPTEIHRVIQVCGLEDCGELVAMATREQLTRIFDLDLWRAPRPGMDEQFDAERFGVWLEVLAALDTQAGAGKLAELDVDLVIAGLAEHVRVFDVAAVTPYRTTDGLVIMPTREHDHAMACEVGGYHIVAKRTESWDAAVAILMSLEAEQADCFHQIMRGCRALSNSGRESDGLNEVLAEEQQAVFDLSLYRERRRDEQGYVTPAEARAFLLTARELQLDGVRPTLKSTAGTPPDELRAYLANTLIAGCVVQDRAFTAKEAWDATVAICNLGLENWPTQWDSVTSKSNDPLVNQDLLVVFQVGWKVLHKNVSMYTAERLLHIAAVLKCHDRDIRIGLNALCVELSRCCREGTPWRARHTFDVIATLDMPVWAALLGMIDECPVLHAAVRAWRSPGTLSVSASSFEFISENSQIMAIHEFVRALPDLLRP